MNQSDAMDLLAEILVNYGNLMSEDGISFNDGGKGIPVDDENRAKWDATLTKYYSNITKG